MSKRNKHGSKKKELAPKETQKALPVDDNGAKATEDDESHTVRVRGHLPALDGIRGIAILLVVIYHSNMLQQQSTAGEKLWFSVVGLGWSGVDVFFVLSGFLITGILVDAKEKAGDDGRWLVWRNFFARRMLRIFPLYYAFIAAHLWLLPALGRALKDPVLQQPVQDPLWFWLYVPNFLFAKLGTFAGPRPLHAMWSLGIEEQFYLVWPLIVLFVARRHLLLVCSAGVAVALGTRLYVWNVGADWVDAFVLPQCRMDTLLIGAALAIWLRRPAPPTGDQVQKAAMAIFALTSVAIVVTIVMTGALRQYSAPIFTVGFSVLAVWAAALLLLSVSAPPSSMTGRVLAFAPLRFVGRYAYGLYLTHTIVQHFVLKALDPQALYGTLGQSRVAVQLVFTLVSTPVAIAVAVAVFHLFERHFLALKTRVPMPTEPAKDPRD